MSESRLAVSSELYDEYSLRKNPKNIESCSKLYVKFLDGSFLENALMIEVDEDGDLIVSRQIVIEVSLRTQLSGVGLQLWRGALLLSDFLIHTRQDNLSGKSLLELGSGVGLTSIVASMFAQRVVATDIDRDGILERIKSNFSLNSKFVSSEVSISPLDFCSTDWSDSLQTDITNSQIIIAADVIYDNDLTEAFIKTLTKVLLTSQKTAFIALEKRYVFTFEDLDSVAPCYEYFLQQLKSAWTSPPQSQWTIEPVKIDFPQFLDYERNKHLVIWRIDS